MHQERWLIRGQLPFLTSTLTIEFIVNCYPAPFKMKGLKPAFLSGRADVFLHPYATSAVLVKKRGFLIEGEHSRSKENSCLFQFQLPKNF